MCVLSQCMAIVDLTSLDWKGEERYSMVAHSFRVMSKARNFDEIVVGLMHEVYAKSSYARALFHCDVTNWSEWDEPLKLLTSRHKRFKHFKYEEEPEDILLEVNLPQNMSEEEKNAWRLEKTKWTRNYKRRLEKIAVNRVARHVAIYDLEDRIRMLKNPAAHSKCLGYPYFALPWKEHYCIKVNKSLSLSVPNTDDDFLLKEASKEERNNLIIKYGRALDFLKKHDDEQFPECDYSEKDIRHNAKVIKEWFDDWYSHEVAEEEAMQWDSTL